MSKTVKRVFFLTEEEAQALGGYVDAGMPHYELEDGSTLYTCGGASDYAIEHWTSANGTQGGRDIQTGLKSVSNRVEGDSNAVS